jgi:acetyltransferase-like isoleucine patch superfamily enzyme
MHLRGAGPGWAVAQSQQKRGSGVLPEAILHTSVLGPNPATTARTLSNFRVMNFTATLRKVRKRPFHALRVASLLGRGHYYRIKFRLLGRRVIIGRRFRVLGKLDIRGPGTVIFGDDCFVSSTYLQPTTPWTHAPDAVIRFGNGVGLAGTRLGCQGLIEVGNNCGLSDARILDSDFHNARDTSGDRQNSAAVTQPVVIGNNVWLGAGSMILKGVTIGDNSVVGAGAVVATHVPSNVIVFGNPAKVIWKLSSQTEVPVHSTSESR